MSDIKCATLVGMETSGALREDAPVY